MDIYKKIDELSREISELLFERDGKEISYSEKNELDKKIKSKKEELYKLYDEVDLYNDDNEDKKNLNKN